MSLTDRRARFKERVYSGKTIWGAGAYDALSALLVEEAGFGVTFTTGYGISASLLGAPDIGLYTMTENLAVVRGVAQATRGPLIADGDTGYGDANNVTRTVRAFETAGAYGLTIEDQAFPKKCPLLPGETELIDISSAEDKIRAALRAREDENFLIIARTDASDPEEAMERANRYAQAGADLVQPVGKVFPDLASLAELRRTCGKPLFVMVAQWFSDVPPEEFDGIAAVVTFPLLALFSATASMRQNLQAAATSCSINSLPAHAVTSKEFGEIIGRISEHP